MSVVTWLLPLLFAVLPLGACIPQSRDGLILRFLGLVLFQLLELLLLCALLL